MANYTETIGVSHCGEIASRNNWLFRPQPTNDIGIDAHIEYIDTLGKPKQLLALQIKSGTSWFTEEKGDYYIFRDINERQYHYWTMNALPCILVLYNPDNDMCIWEKLTIDTIKKTCNGTGKGYSVKVPKNQVFLDSASNNKLLSFSKLPEHIVNYNFLHSQKKFMQILQGGGSVKLHSMEWVNKSSGRGEVELIVDNGESTETYSYPYWFPYTPYTLVFPRLFPWASFFADNEFFEEHDLSLWRDYHCHYDKENDDWIVVGESFEEFRSKLPAMRSIDHSGEVAEYMMELELNELGKSFLMVDAYVTQKQPYSDTRSNGE